jgi:hypothetical protein
VVPLFRGYIGVFKSIKRAFRGSSLLITLAVSDVTIISSENYGKQFGLNRIGGDDYV